MWYEIIVNGFSADCPVNCDQNEYKHAWLIRIVGVDNRETRVEGALGVG